MTKFLSKFANDETGATAVEYGLIAMLISVAVIAILGGVGSSLTTTFTSINNALSH
jgi:pilus assembly protein Flp/PilA